jgi:hypothetical protein
MKYQMKPRILKRIIKLQKQLEKLKKLPINLKVVHLTKTVDLNLIKIFKILRLPEIRKLNLS